MLASRFLASYQELYDIEDRGKTLSPGEREALRAAESRPVWHRLRELLDGEAASRVLPKDKFAEALGYLRNQWDALQVYLVDGRLPIDNNDTEQLMKQVAIGRKNWLFVGSVAAGERAADLLTIVSSAVRNDLDVWAMCRSCSTGSWPVTETMPPCGRIAGRHPTLSMFVCIAPRSVATAPMPSSCGVPSVA